MKLYYETQTLYLDTDASVIRHRASLLQTKSGTSWPRDKAQDNSIFRPIAFASKSVKCRKKIQQHSKRGTRYTTWAQEVPSLLLCGRGEYDNRSQTKSINFLARCSNAISENTINSPQNTPAQSKNHIQTWTRSNHSRLPFKTKP